MGIFTSDEQIVEKLWLDEHLCIVHWSDCTHTPVTREMYPKYMARHGYTERHMPIVVGKTIKPANVYCNVDTIPLQLSIDDCIPTNFRISQEFSHIAFWVTGDKPVLKNLPKFIDTLVVVGYFHELILGDFTCYNLFIHSPNLEKLDLGHTRIHTLSLQTYRDVEFIPSTHRNAKRSVVRFADRAHCAYAQYVTQLKYIKGIRRVGCKVEHSGGDFQYENYCENNPNLMYGGPNRAYSLRTYYATKKRLIKSLEQMIDLVARGAGEKMSAEDRDKIVSTLRDIMQDKINELSYQATMRRILRKLE